MHRVSHPRKVNFELHPLFFVNRAIIESDETVTCIVQFSLRITSRVSSPIPLGEGGQVCENH